MWPGCPVWDSMGAEMLTSLIFGWFDSLVSLLSIRLIEIHFNTKNYGGLVLYTTVIILHVYCANKHRDKTLQTSMMTRGWRTLCVHRRVRMWSGPLMCCVSVRSGCSTSRCGTYKPNSSTANWASGSTAGWRSSRKSSTSAAMISIIWDLDVYGLL